MAMQHAPRCAPAGGRRRRVAGNVETPRAASLPAAVRQALRCASVPKCAAGLLAAGLSIAVPQSVADSFPAEFELSSLAAGDGSGGFVVNGLDRIDGSALHVGAAGDVNGDGLRDLIIGARPGIDRAPAPRETSGERSCPAAKVQADSSRRFRAGDKGQA